MRHIRHWISRKRWFQRTTNRKWPMGYQFQMVTWPMTSRDPERSNSLPHTLRSQYLEYGWRCYLAIANLVNSLLEADTVGYPSNSLASCIVFLHMTRQSLSSNILLYFCTDTPLVWRFIFLTDADASFIHKIHCKWICNCNYIGCNNATRRSRQRTLFFVRKVVVGVSLYWGIY